MYHLTCPSCAQLTESPFVRSGAVVRCTECQNKYRIKSSHFERVVHTGPRTLDETDAVLRSDSVDIEPDEVGPVSIDDEGNVVGLSGLSELMRWSDTQGSKSKLQARLEDDDKPIPPPPAAVVRRQSQAEPAADQPINPRRARLLERKKQKQMRSLLILAAGGVVLVFVVVLAVVIFPGKPTAPAGGSDGGGELAPALPGDPAVPNDPKNTRPAGTNPGTSQVTLFGNLDRPTPNPDSKFVASSASRTDAPPTDVPTVLTPGKRVAHEGWYIMNPPRGSASAAGETDVQLGEELITVNDGAGQTLLTGAVVNRSAQTVMSGELHVMLLDSTGRVYAETYMPLFMIEPDGEQGVALSIPTRHWTRARGTRTAVKVIEWSDGLDPLKDVRIDPVGTHEDTAIRVSARNERKKSLRKALIVVSAVDDRGLTLAEFVVGEQNLDIKSGHWLDLVITTPLPEDSPAVTWSAQVYPR